MPAHTAAMPPTEPWINGAVRASLGAAVLASAIGATESAMLLFGGAARYPDHGVGLVVCALAGYALLGAALAALCLPFARLMWRPAAHLAALPSLCAALGSALAVAAFALTNQVSGAMLVPAALGATLVCLVLRELLAWTPKLTSVRVWLGLLSVALAANAIGVLAFTGSASRASSGQEPRANVLLITLDTLRADHLGCYGADDARTPNIDALAEQSIVFDDATSQANTTGPSHTTMLTGLIPLEHGARQNGVRISDRVRTLPEMLSEEGYSTGAVVSGFTLKNRACGLAPRFDRYDDELIAWTWMPEVCARLRLVKFAIRTAPRRGARILRSDRPADETVDAALAWLGRRADEPWFLWVHCYDPHAPYEPPPPFDRMHDPEYAGDPYVDWYRMGTDARRALVDDPRELAHMRAMYKGEISFVDREVGRLLSWLESAGEDENTLVVLTSDHGEGLGEHGYYFDHGTYLYDTELRVPLIVRLPASLREPQSLAVFPMRLQGQMRLVDLTPTVLEMLGLETPPGMFGASSFSNGWGAVESRPSLAVADAQGDLSGYDLERHKLSVRMNGYKLIWTSEYWLDTTRVPEAFEFYELGTDPLELTNAAHTDPPAGSFEARMREELEAFLSMGAASGGELEVSPELRERLRELGYL